MDVSIGVFIFLRVVTDALGRYALNYSYVLAIPSQAKLAPYEPDRGSHNEETKKIFPQKKP